jgi:hypothetical protein
MPANQKYIEHRQRAPMPPGMTRGSFHVDASSPWFAAAAAIVTIAMLVLSVAIGVGADTSIFAAR